MARSNTIWTGITVAVIAAAALTGCGNDAAETPNEYTWSFWEHIGHDGRERACAMGEDGFRESLTLVPGIDPKHYDNLVAFGLFWCYGEPGWKRL